MDTNADTPDPSQSDADQLRATIEAELAQQAAVDKFQAERPDLWIHVQRVAQIIDWQEEAEAGCFPPGSVFLHTGLPDQQVFSLKRVLEISLDTCCTVIEIHGDNELEAGTAVIPLEAVTWIGLPAERIPLTFEMRGLTASEPPVRERTARLEVDPGTG